MGQAAPQNQIHDFHPPISPEGMYWVVPVPDGGLRFSADGRTATLVMKNVPIVDQPKWPSLDAVATPAFLDYKLVFKAENDPAKYEDASRWYRFTGFQASAQLEAKVRVPSIGFEFKTDALETSKADFAVMGEEVNGKYYG
jgi:hypothetical protein